MSSPWGKIGAVGSVGAWAEEAEQAEAEEKEKAAAAAAAASAPRDPQSFPSLKEAVVNTKGKKKTKMSLLEFNLQQANASSYTPAGSARRGSALESKGLTPEEMLRLPTGPKERSPEEMQYGRLGGGFSSYGSRSSGPGPGRMRERDGDGEGNWGGNRRSSYGGFDDNDRRGPPPRVSDFDQPSRADEVDNWAMGKKPITSSFDGGPRHSRYGSLGSGGGGNEGFFSRADEVDNWAVGKKQQMSVGPPPQPRSSFGSGFRDSAGPGADRWTRGRGFNDEQERPRLVLDKPRSDGIVNEGNVVVKTVNKPNPFGAARPREEILAEKGVDWKQVDMELEAKSSRPTSSHSSRPGSAQSGRSEGPAAIALQQGVSRPKVNPFGDAKPREVLLEEKGVDWRKIDLDYEIRRVDRPDTEAEKNLKEEIERLKMELEKVSPSNANKEPPQVSGEDQTSLHDIILHKERELEQLTRELDDKLRFSQKAMERPSSGAGRLASFPERSPFPSGSFEESRNVEYMERPRSRGTADAWARHGDDRRGFQGGRERGFLGNRDLDRSRERW